MMRYASVGFKRIHSARKSYLIILIIGFLLMLMALALVITERHFNPPHSQPTIQKPPTTGIILALYADVTNVPTGVILVILVAVMAAVWMLAALTTFYSKNPTSVKHAAELVKVLTGFFFGVVSTLLGTKIK